MQRKIWEAQKLAAKGEALLREEGRFEECPEFVRALDELDALATKVGTITDPGYMHTPDDWETCFHQLSLALAACWNGGHNAAINEIRGLIIDGLERHGSR